ncbi:expressed protein [Phakopsora pachyrhizi]|uniref:Expressed protein n=1 Tax=Phakopsora pachyrhizi TaxID=170000 RepID=A0AAV0BMH2_PHAPC|nr:expressed protein [Phakopsora pachyrhizi]
MSKRVSKRSTTTTNRSSRQVIDDVDRKDRSIKPTTASTNKQSVSRSSTHYYSIVPLHLIFTTYVIHFLPTIQSLKLNEPTGTIAKSRTDVLIDSLVVDPYRTLLIINSGLFLVQIWFSSSLRKLREDEINSSSDSNLVDRGGAVEDQSQKRDLLRSFSVDRVFDRSYRQNFLSSTNQNLKKSLSKFIMLVQESVTMTILGTFMIHMVMVLLGSNLIKDSLKTLLISNTVSIVCVLPTSFVIGWNRGREKQRLIRIFSSFQS